MTDTTADVPLQRLTFKLNGSERSLEVEPDESLLEVLRDRLGITSPKDGCSPQGQCGCCVVKINGQGVTSCAMKARSLSEL